MQLTKLERFEQWQGPNANTQKPFIDSVMRVETYLGLKKLTLDQLKKDIEGDVERSWHYKLVYNLPWLQRMKGILLYSILDIEEVSYFLTTPLEDTKLTAIFNDLHALYLSSLDKPAERIPRLLTCMNDLLQMDVWLFSDLTQAKKIHLTLYLGLGTLNQALNNPPYGSGLFASMVGINFKEIHGLVKTLLMRAEDKIAKLEQAASMVAHAPVVALKKQDEVVVTVTDLDVNKISSPTPLNEEPDELYECYFIEQVPLEGKKKTIQEYFDRHYLERFTGEGTVKEQLKSVLDYSRDLKVLLNQFIATRAEEKQISGYQRQITRLKKAFEDNDSQIIGRKYVLELYEQYHDEFTSFKKLIPDDEREILEQNMEQQEENPALLHGLYVLSTVFAPVNVLSRLLLSEEDSQGLAELTPTLDAQAKALVKDLAPIVLTNLDKMLKTKKTQKQQLQLCLSSGDRAFELQLLMASPADLAELSTLNSVSQTFDELTTWLAPSKKQVTFVPIPLHEMFQKRYIKLMKTQGDEKQKTLTLIDCMNKIVKDLQLLLQLKKRKHDVLLKIKPLHTLMDLFHQHTSNQHIGSVVNVPLKQLQTQLNAVTKELNTVVSRLSLGDPEIKESLRNSSIDFMQDLTQVHKEAMACIDEYKILQEKITLLIQMTKGTSALDNYIAQNYTWWVRFTNFLAQFLSIFRTDAGRMVDEARELKERIGTCQIQCERDIKARIAVIKEDQIIGADLLSDLPKQHDYQHTQITDAEQEPFDEEQTMTLLSSLSMYAPKVSRIILEKQEELNYDERLGIN